MSIRDKTVINKSIAIAVDFGTSRTGYAYGFPGREESNKEMNWDDAPESYCKTLTKIAYNEDDEPEFWGFTAWKEMLDDCDEDRVLRLFEFFKMGLFTDDHVVRDTTGTVEKDALDVVVDYLKFLFEKIKEDLSKRVGKDISPAEIVWCLTIPAIWKDAEKSLMRQAAYRAGMIEVEHPPEDVFMLVLEPEAAAVFCMMQLKRQGNPLRDGDKFLVLDAGGGTVDLTAHTYSKGKLKEITTGSGGPCGSSELDKKFEKLMSEIFGEKVMDDMRKKHAVQHFELLSNWESAKCRTKDLNDRTLVKAPGVLNAILRRAEFSSSCFDSDSNTIILDPNLLNKIYMDIIEQICTLVADQIDACKSTTGSSFDYIFIVGGFGGSIVLQDIVKSRFGTMINKGIVVPPVPGEAIVDGALYLGLDPSIISSRRMRMTYGCAAMKVFDPNIHDPKKRKVIGSTTYCVDIFDKFVTNGEEVEIDKGVTSTYKASLADQKSMVIAVYGTKVTNMNYIDDPASNKIGEIIIDMSDTSGGINRCVEVTMYFGKSEIQLHAIEKNSGKEYKAAIKFQGELFETEHTTTHHPEHKYHIIFSNDRSGSMGSTDVVPSLSFLKSSHNNRLGALYEACSSFLDQRSGSQDIVSCIMYDDSSSICFERRPLCTSLVKDYMLRYTASGGTCFYSAMSAVQGVVSRNPNGYTPIVIFMTDGECSDEGASSTLRNIVSLYSHTGFKLHSVLVGRGSYHSLLQEFARIGGGTFSTSGLNLADMKQTYTQLAGRLE